VFRCFRPQRLIREIQRFLGSVLDPRFMEPPAFNLTSLYRETSSHSPVLFVLSNNINTLSELLTLRHQLSLDTTAVEYMPLGSNAGERVEQLIIKCAQNGTWLLLENLHLVADWVPAL